VLVGLSGFDPETLDPDQVGPLVAEVKTQRKLHLGGRLIIEFEPETDLVLHMRKNPARPSQWDAHPRRGRR
jgi:L-serine dehydratase